MTPEKDDIKIKTIQQGKNNLEHKFEFLSMSASIIDRADPYVDEVVERLAFLFLTTFFSLHIVKRREGFYTEGVRASGGI